jgi:lysophospholipase
MLAAQQTYDSVIADLEAKQDTGFLPSLVDPLGRLLSYMLLPGQDGGVDVTLSSIASVSSFRSYAAPFPILISLGTKPTECTPGPNATTYEFTPYEFGSWDSDVSAFVKTKHLGTTFSGGIPANGTCISNFDNIGFAFGASSNLFNAACSSVPPAITSTDNTTVGLIENLAEIVSYTHNITTRDEYAVIPNPFYQYNSSTGVPNVANPIWTEKDLHLVDGSESLQDNPIWPFLQPARSVDVLIVNDNTADTASNFPNGSQILTTYVQSFNHNLTRMPYVPSVETFLAKGLDKRPSFFGCGDLDKLTIIYIPNVNLTYQSNQSTYKQEYSPDEQEGMISNGVALASQDSDEN